ncbi:MULTISPECIES: transglycosylase family protein [unclassified Streptomyces]|uniref:transglycosylase family protein n=1 Tax=unclassified Streptomyces TaxID=2593676 RepID=UPI000F6E09EB|nr:MULTISPECIES: transglycosylase family protein [unclassified Streptomyces]AZM61825.1 peptigoglycan-binding protein LysM [Streptomyces sp. WAC 01438]RSM92818.1 peptigoglycan-binding protein LysM [Streptomyces sp. WAC 01420]
MLSGNGRHRRPRQAPALLVTAGVTGSAIAIPLLGAGSASAADGSTWDRVAECESGGKWSQNSGNGYYGGLQLTQEDWEKYGGLDYAPSADQASRGQQIAVAEAILADQGVGAWRTCGLLSGLNQDSPAADVDTGTSGSSKSSGSSGTGRTSSSPSYTPSADSYGTDKGKETPEGSGDESGEPGKSTPSSSPSSSGEDGDKSPGSSASPSASATSDGDKTDKTEQSDRSSADSDEGTGRHRGASADESEGEEDESESSGRHARGLDAWGSAGTGSSAADTGDSAASLTDSLATDDGWRALHTVNAQLIGIDLG